MGSKRLRVVVEIKNMGALRDPSMCNYLHVAKIPPYASNSPFTH
jgi:hypothetical protein